MEGGREGGKKEGQKKKKHGNSVKSQQIFLPAVLLRAFISLVYI